MPTPFLVRIAPGDGLPIYRQIVEQVKAAIASGVLAEGDRIPSHRDLARELVVAPLTVSRAYEMLEREGFIATSRGRGTFVATPQSKATHDASKALHERADALVRQAMALGMSRREVVEAMHAAWRERKERPCPTR